MSQFLKQYGDTEGPLGIPMTDKQAQAVEQILNALPADQARRQPQKYAHLTMKLQQFLTGDAEPEMQQAG